MNRCRLIGLSDEPTTETDGVTPFRRNFMAIAAHTSAGGELLHLGLKDQARASSPSRTNLF